VALAVSAGVSATAIADDGEVHRNPRIEAPIAVDGVLDDPGWRDALVLELGYEVTPGENIPPLVRTEVLLCFDEDRLYVAFRAHDPEPGAIRARYSDRDRIFDDDWVAVVLDTFDDARRSFDFFVNPLGIQGDSIETTGGSSVTEWDAIWDSAGRIGDDGYVVEMAIPFSSLRFQPTTSDQTWRFDAVRSYPRGVDHRLAVFPRDRSDNCYLCQADRIRGFAGASPGHAVELDPTLTALRSEVREPFPDGGFVERDSSVDLGLTARWGVTPNLNLSAVVNPDFSQVEADAAQLDINTQFSLFYPEKRPFFLEGVDYFTTRSFEYYAHYIGVSPGFRADLGFIPRAGYHFYDSGVLFTWQHDDSHHWYNLLKVWFGYEYEDDWDGRMLRTAPGTFVEYHGPLQSSAFAILYGGRRTYRGVEYDNRSIDSRFEIQPVGDLRLSLRVQAGDAIDFEFARPGDRIRLTPSLQLYAGRHLSLELDHIYERFDLEEGRLYTADLSELRTIYQFNRRAFMRLILQYADNAFEEERYPRSVEPESRELLSQLLFTYKVNPWTAVYLGYSDTSIGDNGTSLTQLDRTAFLKIGYAWVP
jgi:hypothetical protein